MYISAVAYPFIFPKSSYIHKKLYLSEVLLLVCLQIPRYKVDFPYQRAYLLFKSEKKTFTNDICFAISDRILASHSYLTSESPKRIATTVYVIFCSCYSFR